ncbi:unnamed protein product [Notodromas monacha]|uniref:DOMON domain-containing protein n=1 Tax=Notodromas monacha TaxID=399045 RepID=A0A7R9BXC2_9CRUS|nr:unnamed protein product [Notodromas monacha]CAG0923445.1 unnamed protein product [Notodromas monacha]
MCLAFLSYYPRSDLMRCFTFFDFDLMQAQMGFPDLFADGNSLTWMVDQNTTWKEYLNNKYAPWSQETVDMFQQIAALQISQSFGFCLNEGSNVIEDAESISGYPDMQEYEPPPRDCPTKKSPGSQEQCEEMSNLYFVFLVIAVTATTSHALPGASSSSVNHKNRVDVAAVRPKQDDTQWTRHAVLDKIKDGKIHLFWNYDKEQQELLFEVQAQVTGWVGVGFSPNGGMSGADIVTCWDRHANQPGLPTLDASQDYTLISATENGTHTICRFSRKVDTCDLDQDYFIQSDTVRVIYAFGETDPEGDDPFYHQGNRGTASIYLLDPPPSIVSVLLDFLEYPLGRAAAPKDAFNYVLAPNRCHQTKGNGSFGAWDVSHSNSGDPSQQGRRMKLRLVRNGIEEPWFQYDDHYDFEYQEFRVFPEEKKLIPGDILILECTMDSTGKTGVTSGGWGTDDEMCLAFLNYYPKSELLKCFTMFDFDTIQAELGFPDLYPNGILILYQVTQRCKSINLLQEIVQNTRLPKEIHGEMLKILGGAKDEMGHVS